MTSMLKGGKNDTAGWMQYGGCSCHNSKADHRTAKKSAKVAEKKQWKKDFEEESR